MPHGQPGDLSTLIDAASNAGGAGDWPRTIIRVMARSAQILIDSHKTSESSLG